MRLPGTEIYAMTRIPAGARAFISKAQRSTFVRRVAILATGTAGAQALNLAFAPLLTRLYGPDAFGVLGIYMAVLALIAPAAALTLPMAVVLEKSEDAVAALTRLVAKAALTVAALVTILLWLFQGAHEKYLSTAELGALVYLVPVALIFHAWQDLAKYKLLRSNIVDIIAKASLAHSVAVNIVKSAFGVILPAGMMLVVASAAGTAFHAFLLTLGLRKAPVKCEEKTPQDRQISVGKGDLTILRRHKNFPLYMAPRKVLREATKSAPILVLAAMFEPAMVGFYVLARMVLGAPSNLIGKAVKDAFFPRFAESHRAHGNSFILLLRTTGWLMILAAVPFATLGLLGYWIFGIVFGGEWVAAGLYVQWLSVFYFFNFISMPAIAAVPVLDLQRMLLVYEVASTFARVGSLIVAARLTGDDVMAIATFSIISAFFLIALIALVFINAHRYAKK